MEQHLVDRRRRIVYTLLAGMAVLVLVLSWWLPFWHVTLKAPQYPTGLHVQVYLNKLVGDVMEIDILNHYIGMKKLEEAARFERSVALYALALISLLTLLFVFSGRKTMALLALPALLFPIGFVADLSLWLYHFGHDLDPRAPIRLKPFTPALLGEGKIAQFATEASFGIGFYLIIAALAFVLVALIIRFSVCRGCPQREQCGLVCPNLFWRSSSR